MILILPSCPKQIVRIALGELIVSPTLIQTRSPVNFSILYHTLLAINGKEKFTFDRLLVHAAGVAWQTVTVFDVLVAATSDENKFD